MINQLGLGFGDGHTRAVEPVVACAVTANHERAIVRLTTKAVHFTIVIPIFRVFVVVVWLLVRFGRVGLR